MLNTPILVTASDTATLQYISALLSDAGYSALATASSAAAAVKKAEELSPGLVIMETTLRRTNDGIDTIKKIKKSMNIPVIYLASNDSPELFSLARNSEPFGYFTQPVCRGELCIAVDAALRYGSATADKNMALFPEENPAPVMRISYEGILLYANQASNELLRDWGCGVGEAVPGYLWQVRDGMLEFDERREIEIDSRGRKYSFIIVPITDRKYINLYGRDVTVHKQAEEALNESQRHINTIVDSIADGFYAIDRDWRITHINDAAVNYFDRPRGELIGLSLFEAFPAIRGSIFEAGFHHAMETGETVRIEAHSLVADKTVELYAYPGAEGMTILFRDVTERHRLAQTLQESESRFRLVLKNAPVSVAAQDRDLRFTYAYNQRAVPADEVTGKTDADLFIPEDAARLIRLKRKAIESGTEIREGMWLTVNGKRLYLDLYIEPIRDVSGLITGIGIATVDMTQMKQAEQAMRTIMERFELLAETAGKLLQTQNPQEVVNSQCRKLMEYLGCDIFINYLADDRAGRLRLNAYAGIPGEEAVRIQWLDYGIAVCGCAARDRCRIVAEHIGTTPDQRTELVKSFGVRAYACHPMLDESGSVIGTLSFGTRTRDTFSEEDLTLMKAVTDQVSTAMIRMKNEQMLRETRDYLDSLINYANAPIIVWDPSFRITRFNRAFEGLTGLESDRVIGNQLDILFPDKSKGESMSLIESAVSGERWETVEIPILHSSGDIRMVLWNSANIHDKEGTVISTIAQGQDITERKKMEKRLKHEQMIDAGLAGLSETLISQEMTMQKVVDKVLETARQLTLSRHGYVGVVDKKTGDLIYLAFPPMQGEECPGTVPEKKLVFPANPDGSYNDLWGHPLNTLEPFFNNSPGKQPAAIEITPGHIPPDSLLSVPVVFGGVLVGHIAMANPEHEYTANDLNTVKRVANLFALAIQRIHYENAMEDANQTLEQKVRERTLQLYQINEKLMAEIEERTKAEEALRQSELKFRTVADFTYAGEYWVDTQGNYVYVSPSVERITGYRPEEFMENRELLTGIIYGDDRAEFITHLEDEHHAGEPQEIVFRIIKKDGSIRHVAHVCTPVYGEAGEYIGRRASNRDVTKQRLTEIKLREREEVANALINTPAEPVLLIEVDGTIIDANVEMVKRMQSGKNRVIGMSMYDIIGKDMAMHRQEKINTALEIGKALRFEEQSEGSWFDTIIYPVRDHQGMITKMAIMSRDITEMRRLQKDIMEISELERQRIGQDLHDSLGQKLTGIGFLAEALKQTMQEKSYPEVADIEEIIFNVTDSIDQARKISSGLWTNRFESYDAALVLEELAVETRNLFRISCEFNNEIDRSVVNKTVVNNLYNIARESVNNSIKHGKADNIEISLKEDDEQIYLSIKDNGMGAIEGFEEKKGIGLRIMRYRAGIIGGSMTVKSSKNGFEVFIAIKKEFLDKYLQ